MADSPGKSSINKKTCEVEKPGTKGVISLLESDNTLGMLYFFPAVMKWKVGIFSLKWNIALVPRSWGFTSFRPERVLMGFTLHKKPARLRIFKITINLLCLYLLIYLNLAGLKNPAYRLPISIFIVLYNE